jgi:predicted nucleic acid-binding protein
MIPKCPLLYDSHALLKLFQKERGHEKVIGMLEQAHRTGTKRYLNAINLGEIIYTTKRSFGDQKKIEVLAHIERLGFTILPVPANLVFRAAELKAEFSISFAGCFALASAVEHKAIVITGDREFKKVEHLVDSIWVEEANSFSFDTFLFWA